MERKYFGLTMADVMRLAYQLPVRNGIKNLFCKRNEKAGRKWLKIFICHHPQISVRTPKDLSLSRSRGFTPESVAEFFFNLRTRSGHQHNPARLYNCDETGISIVQNKHMKILGLKGKHQITSLQSTERGSLVTVVTCMSPTGQFIPPLLAFPRKNLKQDLMNGTPPGSIHACHSSGFLYFSKRTKTTKEYPVILVLDRHYSHTRNLEVITLARENYVYVICLPPHSGHKMQPLDKTFMGPLKTFCCQEIEKWLRSHPGRVVTFYQIGELFGNAYKRAATGEIAANGFRATALFPCDKNIFRPYDFPLSSEDKDAAPVIHPALIKTTSAEALRYQPCAKPEPKAKSL